MAINKEQGNKSSYIFNELLYERRLYDQAAYNKGQFSSEGWLHASVYAIM